MKRNFFATLSCLLCLTLMLPACTGGSNGASSGTEPDSQNGEPTDAVTQQGISEPTTPPATEPVTDADITPATEPDTEPVTPPEIIPPDVVDVELTFDRPIIYLGVGESIDVGGNIATDKYVTMSEDILYASSDALCTYQDGILTAVGGGLALLTAANPYTGRTATTLIRVIDRAKDETCIIGAPFWNYQVMDETQMKYLADANFNAVFMSQAPDRNIIEYFELAAQYGIKVYPQLATTAVSELGLTDEQIRKRIDKFKAYPAFAGFNLRDEPSSGFDQYARVAQFVHDYDSDLIAMINFLPDASRQTLYNYASRLYDDNYQGVLSFDNYIFGLAAGSVSETWLFRNFELYRQAGIDNRCRTAFYIQSIGSDKYGYRRPDEGTMFYHGMVSLAYGCTMMRYFSYVTPNLEEYTDGVIDIEGNPTDLFSVTTELNRKYASYGLWLIHANADEVYHTGSKLDSGADYRILPDDYWITPADAAEAKKRTILTTFTDRYTGQNYLMVVNKDFANAVTVTYKLDNVAYLYEVDEATGLLIPVDVTDGTLTVELTKGNGRLYVLPFEYTYTTATTPAVNLICDAYITVSSVSDAAGCGAEYIKDGQNLSADGRLGWKALSTDGDAWVKADLGMVKTFNRLDLYPAGNGAACGRFFPATAELQVSDDGVNWRTVATVQKPENWDTGVSVTFEAVSARFVRLYIPALYPMGNYNHCEIAEFCLFNDDGTLPAVEKTDYQPLVYDPGVNVALGKKCCDYSSAQNTMEWQEHEVFLTDGNTTDNAFSSAVCRNGSGAAHEYVVLDLANTYPIDKIILYPYPDGSGFPRSYTVEISEDGAGWTVVHKVEAGAASKGEPVIITFDTTLVAFIKVDATLLTLEANPNAGYVLQIAELEAYTPEK